MSPFLRRPSQDRERAAIDGFWTWWADAKERLAPAVDAGDLSRLPTEIGTRVRRIHSGLSWEVGPGVDARHGLCISGEGDLELRALAGRVVEQAPSTDAEWEYYPARRAKGDLLFSIQVGATEVSASDARFGIDTDAERERLDLTIWHPIYASVPDQVRKQIGLLLLDSLVGEDGIEKWIGGIDVVADEPPEAVDATGLLQALRDLESAATGERWAILSATSRNGVPFVIAINVALKPIDHLDKPVRLDVWIEGRDLLDQRMPSSDETAAWSDWEDAVDAQLSHWVSVGRVTGDGRRRITWHVANGDAAKIVILEQAKRLSWKSSVSVQSDPRWTAFKANLF